MILIHTFSFSRTDPYHEVFESFCLANMQVNISVCIDELIDLVQEFQSDLFIIHDFLDLVLHQHIENTATYNA